METANLTKAMIEENNKLEVKSEWDVVHYKATDVMGDSRCLVAVPLLAALGFKVPSIQGKVNVFLGKFLLIPFDATRKRFSSGKEFCGLN